jgi:hypothetical protein
MAYFFIIHAVRARERERERESEPSERTPGAPKTGEAAPKQSGDGAARKFYRQTSINNNIISPVYSAMEIRWRAPADVVKTVWLLLR